MHSEALDEVLSPISMCNFECAEPEYSDFFVCSGGRLLYGGVVVRERRDEVLEFLLALLLKLNDTLLGPRLLQILLWELEKRQVVLQRGLAVHPNCLTLHLRQGQVGLENNTAYNPLYLQPSSQSLHLPLQKVQQLFEAVVLLQEAGVVLGN